MHARKDTIDFKLSLPNDDSLYIPLASIPLLCKKHNVKIFDFNKYLDNDFHFKAVRETKNLSNFKI